MNGTSHEVNGASEIMPSDLPAHYRGARRGSVSAEVISRAQQESYVHKIYPKSDETAAAIRRSIGENFLFDGLSAKQLRDVIDCMFEKRVEAGENVMVQGEDGDNYYVVTSGVFEAVKNGSVVCKYDGSGAFGELALMYNCPRAATIVARTAGELWALERSTFTYMLLAERKKRAVASETWLAKIPVLDYLDSTDRARVCDALVSKDFAAGVTIFEQGEVGLWFYLVEEGEAIGVHMQDDGSTKEVAHFREGDYFGERALITDDPRALTVVAKTALKVLCLDAPGFERLLGPCKHAMQERIASYQSLSAAAAEEEDEEPSMS
eukprot:CAMPEP_0119413722 /NCGR_PEP_ID=MMETSP1335-20130426/5707_1 /TAXON_ID=259385 /ORGANISM="Chrysoculter rhomboideus, Strain RCC1486" /LENGTH=321 /DNA_ID=CAMNT_0007438531 /DNA_START=55 /DNA_END=1020 /DNA_ORIENTATION=+